MEKTEQDVIHWVVQWAQEHVLIRAVLLTSSRATPQAPLDRLSDYDVIVVVSDLRPFVDDESWMRAYGAPLVLFRDTHMLFGFETRKRLVLYEDGTKIDYTIWPVELLPRVLEAPRLIDELDGGYRVLLDKDNLTSGLKPPTYTAHIPCKPTEEEFLALVEEFWWETTYVAKNLWRDELFYAKYNLDVVIKFDLLRRLLEWLIEINHNWSLKPGIVGRGLKKLLPPEVWAQVESTFVGADIEENWQALFKTTALFREVALAVAAHLGYTYPHDLDRRVMCYLSGLKDLASEQERP